MSEFLLWCLGLGLSLCLPGVGKCPVLGILNITFKYLLVIISPIVG